MRCLVVGWVVLAMLCGAVVAEEVAETAARAKGDPALAGFWTGQIQVPGRAIDVSVNLVQDGESWSGKIDIPLQAIRRADMTGVAVAGKTATFQIPGVPGNPTFEGTLDGDALAGNYTQGGQSIPFRLERADKPADYDTDLYADYRKPGRKGEGAAGDWLALLESGPHRYRLKLNLQAGAEGAASGSLVSVDQRETSFPVEALTLDGNNVAFGVARIGLTFEGALSADGSEISGTWTQGGQGLPLTFRRRQ